MMPQSFDSYTSVSLKLFIVLSKAYKTIMERAVQDMKKYGLTPTEFMILEVLYIKGKIPLQQIGEKILVTSGSITYNIDKLESKGLLQRIPCDKDRRVIYAEMTRRGKEWFSGIFEKHVEVVVSMTDALCLDEKREITELLKKLGKGAEAG